MQSLEGWKVGRLAGIDIRIDATWTFILFLVGYSFFVILGIEFPDTATGTVVVLAVVMTLTFFGSLLVHELAHAVVARNRGIEVRGITLFLFGGATHARLETHHARDELVTAAVGPAASLLIAATMWGVVEILGDVIGAELAYAVGRLGWLNLILAVFNLVPGFPLDGGRILRAVIWARTGDLLHATRIASQTGRAIAHLLIAVGVLQVLLGGFVGGLWLAAIGWFLNQAAQVSYNQLQMRRIFGAVEASDVTARDVIDIPSDASVQVAVDDYFMRYDHNAFPVAEGDRTVGLITLSSVRKIPNDDWPLLTVDRVMKPLSAECSVDVHDRVDHVIDKLETVESRRVLVVEGDHVVGIITPRDLTRWMHRVQQLHLQPPE